MKVQVQRTYTITWDGDNIGYIRCADDLNKRRTGSGLDSIDLGDATGAILEWAQAPDSDGGTEHDSCFLTFEGHMLGVSWEWELFTYPEPGTGPGQIDLDSCQSGLATFSHEGIAYHWDDGSVCTHRR